MSEKKKNEDTVVDQEVQEQAELKDDRKVFYSIGEVAKRFQVQTSTIRYWENEFDILKPKKNNKGNRLFTRKDMENLKLIYHLLKEKGMTLKGAKMKLNDNPADTIQTFEIVKRLQEVREELLGLKEEMDKLHDIK